MHKINYMNHTDYMSTSGLAICQRLTPTPFAFALMGIFPHPSVILHFFFILYMIVSSVSLHLVSTTYANSVSDDGLPFACHHGLGVYALICARVDYGNAIYIIYCKSLNLMHQSIITIPVLNASQYSHSLSL